MNPFPYRLIALDDGPMVTVANDILVNSVLELYGEYSGDEVALLASLCNEGDFILDVGAHIGCLTVELAKRVGPTGRVVSFEPQDRLSRALEANRAIRGLHHVEVKRVAAALEPGNLKVHDEVGGFLRNHGAARLGTTGSEEVEARSIDSYGFPPCQLAKIDVEGMELDVLRGAAETIGPNTIVYFENSLFDEASDLSKSHALFSHFLDRNYDLFWHLPQFVSRKSLAAKGVDVFKFGGSFNVLALPSWKTGSEAVTATPKAALRPITRPDAIAFPIWLDPRLVRRSVYDEARARGAAPLRSGDDPERPWIALYEAFLEYLDHLADDLSLAGPPRSGTSAGWATAELWFTLAERDLSEARIVSAGLPPVLVALASLLCPVFVLDGRAASDSLHPERVTQVGSLHEIPDEDRETVLLIKGTVQAAMAALDVVAARSAGSTSAIAWVTDEADIPDIRRAPPVWWDHDRAGVARFSRGRAQQ